MRWAWILLIALPAYAGSHVGGPRNDDGTEVACDLPSSMHQKNTGGSDGAGLCVYASARHTGLWQDDAAFRGLFEYMKTQPGGSYPEKFDKTLKAYCAKAHLPVPNYVQIENPNDYDLLKLACKNGLMPGVTYSFSPTGRYGGKKIAHMVSLPGADDQWAVVLDNNYVGTFEWDTVSDFKKAHAPNAWAIVLLRKSPPPPPRSKR